MNQETINRYKEIIENAPKRATHVEIHGSGNVNCYQWYSPESIHVYADSDWIPAQNKTLG